MKHIKTGKVSGKKLILLLLVLVNTYAAVAGAKAGPDRIGTGDTCISIEIITSVYDYATGYDIYTDESNLLDALLGIGFIEGEESSSGFYITTVNGRKADYEREGEYWVILPLGTSLEKTPIQDGDMFTFSLENNGIVEALAIDNLSSRSGPSTKFRETGTYKVKGEYVQLISLAYDENDIGWVQCEVTYGNKLRRVYTGLKRFDITTFNLNRVAEEEPHGYRAKVTATSKAMYGPGSDYGTYDSLTVDKGQTVIIITFENDYAQVEWKTSKQSYRAWVPVHTLKY